MPNGTQAIHSMRDQICSALLADVFSGQINSDEPLREHDFAKRFGVSRGSVRDAFMQLSHERVLVYQKNCGVRVNPPPNKRDLQVFVKLRHELEGQCLDIVKSAWTKTDDQAIKGLLLNLWTACEIGEVGPIAEADLALHQYWVQRASKELESVWLGITVRMLVDYTLLDNYVEVYREHESIVERILQRDWKAAKSSIKENVRCR